MTRRWLICMMAVAASLGGCSKPQQGAQATPGIVSPAESWSTNSPSHSLPSPTTISTRTPTQEPLFLTATVWISDPQVPILAYHRFLPDRYDHSTAVKTRLADFRSGLEALYATGYSLVSVEDWLSGDLRMQSGRRPLMMTIDDLFFADQISLNDAGEPSEDSGIGVLWRFSQEHPDFGFAAGLFIVLGDKLYPGGEEALAQVIVWCIEHGAMPYNHLYTHPHLDLTEPRWIRWEAAQNDRYLRELLVLAGREDLVARLGNLIALPYGEWPRSASGQRNLMGYVSPEGVPLQGIFEVDYYFRARYLEAPYSPGFDPWHIPRIVGTQNAIDLLTEVAAQFPIAQTCRIGPIDRTRRTDPEYLAERAQDAHRTGGCPAGVYSVERLLFRVGDGGVTRLYPQTPSPDAGP